MAKIRVYELAKELGKDNKEMETAIRGLGFEIKGVMSTLDDDQAQMVRRQMQGGAPPRNDSRREPDRRPNPMSGSGNGSPSTGSPGSAAASTGSAGSAGSAPPSGPMVIRRRGMGPRPTDEDEVVAPPPPVRAEAPRPPLGGPVPVRRPVAPFGSSSPSGPSAGPTSTTTPVARPAPLRPPIEPIEGASAQLRRLG